MKLCLLAFIFLANIAIAQERRNITVAKDSSGDYTTIQEAVNAVRDFSYFPVKIFIKKGVYEEKLVIPSWKSGITLSGEDKDSVIITGSDHTGKPFPGKDPSGKTVYGTFTSYTVLVAGDDITIENLTIENTTEFHAGQGVALHAEGDRFIIRNCKLIGNQDTLYAGNVTRQYYYKCYIEGTTDFIFGAATAIFKECIIKSKFNSYITAASTTKHQLYGFVFMNCKLIADPKATKVYLGRPWRPYSATIFMNCTLGNHILPVGWHNWDKETNEKTARYAEYKNEGPGADTGKRVAWSRQLSEKEVKNITVTKVFKGWDPLKQSY